MVPWTFRRLITQPASGPGEGNRCCFAVWFCLAGVVGQCHTPLGAAGGIPVLLQDLRYRRLAAGPEPAGAVACGSGSLWVPSDGGRWAAGGARIRGRRRALD